MTMPIRTEQRPLALALPDGYSVDDAAPVTRDSVPGYQLYGGADISRASDANGILYVACCARGPDGDFRFRVFRYVGQAATEVPLPARCTGRGEISSDQYSGKLVWIAWEGNLFYTGEIPGAAPFPSAGAAQPGAYVPLQPNAYSPTIDGQAVSGGRALDIPALYGVPAGCRAYNVRLVGQAAQPNTRVRLGSEQQPGQLTINCQLAQLQLHQVGIVNAGPGGSVWVSVVDSSGQATAAQVWLTVGGYWP